MEYSFADLKHTQEPYKRRITKLFLLNKSFDGYEGTDYAKINDTVIFNEQDPRIFLSPTPDSVSLKESPKTNNGGDFIEFSFSCVHNIYTAAERNKLETASSLPVYLIVQYEDGSKRIFGDKDNGLKMTYTIQEAKRLQKVTIELMGAYPRNAPYSIEGS